MMVSKALANSPNLDECIAVKSDDINVNVGEVFCVLPLLVLKILNGWHGIGS
jgi:hypothetical protein